MSWSAYHEASEQLASLAEVQACAGNQDVARNLYGLAGKAESLALHSIPPGTLPRTVAITVVSAAALFHRAGWEAEKKLLANHYLRDDDFPQFARVQLRDMLLPRARLGETFWEKREGD